ncbi:hypothetical protein PLESTM_001734500 [Pleodorina starrii]|nr:hypothetical protein PLESTM_001734500 [Pleodorina starrii]
MEMYGRPVPVGRTLVPMGTADRRTTVLFRPQHAVPCHQCRPPAVPFAMCSRASVCLVRDSFALEPRVCRASVCRPYPTGLWHSWRNGVEYEDYSTAMGRGDACPNAAETSRMGWATPASGGGAINTTVLTSAGVPRSYVLPASYITGNGNYLRVVPNWLPSYTNYQTAKNLYIDVRVAKLGDAALGTAYAPMVNIHEVNATMDNGLPTSYANSDRKIQVIGMIASLARVNLTAYNLVVYGGSWATTDNMRVHLCRFATSPSHCKDVVGL